MKFRIRVSIGILALLAAVLDSARAAPPPAGCEPGGLSSGAYTMDHGGVTRNFRLHVPEGFENDTPAPLVLVFHGWGGDENEFLAIDSVTSQAGRRGYILAAPRGLGAGAPDHGNNSWTFSGSATGLDGDGVKEGLDGDTEAICDPGITPD